MTNRVIKFRAWNRKKKQFDTCRNGGNCLSFSLDCKGISCLNVRGYMVYSQFTGLLDKNGKEIYEGDITNEGEIVFGGGAFFIKGDIQNLITFKDLEVLGNIYENLELIKKLNIFNQSHIKK